MLIIEVKNDISRVCYLTSQKCKFAAVPEGREGTMGVMEGRLGLTAIMDFIPQSEALIEGEKIITSGLEPGIPRGLMLGRVTRIVSENNDVWKKAEIEPLSDFNQLTIASVLLP